MSPQRFFASKASPSADGAFPVKRTLQEAWNLFAFSAMFGVLFNLFYAYGVDLNLKIPKKSGLQEPVQAPNGPTTYAGWNKSTPGLVKSTATPTPLSAAPADGLPRLSLIGVKGRFDKKSCVFLDARPPDEYKEGHIPGALNFYPDDFDQFAPKVLPSLSDKGQEIVCYCHGTACELSLELAKHLTNLGYTNVKVFFGGWPQWKKAGYPINTGEGP